MICFGCCSPPNSGCTWLLGSGSSNGTSLSVVGTECASATVALAMDTPTRDSGLGVSCPAYYPLIEIPPGGMLLAPTAVCQAPYSTASGVSLKPGSPVTIRSLVAGTADIAPPFTLRFTAPGAAVPVDVNVPATLACIDLPGAGFTVPAATSGYTLQLILPLANSDPGDSVVLERLSELPCPSLPPPRQVCLFVCTLQGGSETV